jgi:hypothetical protein
MITVALNNKKVNKLLKIPEYYPNTHLEKTFNQSTKTFLVDENIQK